MAIDKPAGMIVHGDGTGERTLTDYASDLLLAMGDGFAATDMQPLNRLDRNTTGVVLFSLDKQTQPASQKEGCYIATCVYGSYDCPQVRLLRRFRDEHMKKTPAGRIFIRLYYAVSPVLVRCFGKNPAFHVFWRHILDSLIRRLESGR